MNQKTNPKKKNRGAALITSFGVMAALAVASSSYINSATQTLRTSKRLTHDVITGHLCEAGTAAMLRSIWQPFKIAQKFTDMDAALSGASANDPKGSLVQTLPGVGKVASGVIGYSTPDADGYQRMVIIRSVGWLDSNNNGAVDDGEPRKTVDVSALYELARSQVFDYTYFVNNYGWMDGFQPSWLIVNGDMRANGNFDFLNGYPTVNGSIYAATNEKLTPNAVGLINDAPVKWDNATYKAQNANNPRARQVYDAANAGAKGSADFEKWRDLLFDADASLVNGRSTGAVMADTTGTKGWTKTSSAQATTTNLLDSTATKEIILPDLSDINFYTNLSQTYNDEKATFQDGSANPNYGTGAKIEVWDQTLNSGAGGYTRLDTNGVVTGSAMVIGSDAHPIKIHGPVTVTQDCVIKGTVQGQGTVYTGRNVHIVGSIKYSTGPDFRGSDLQGIENANEKKDFLGLAARGSVIMGNPKTFGFPYPLTYMTPPFTKARKDDSGNEIPAYDATKTDATGFKLYQSVFGDDALDAVSSGVNQIDAVMYTNFVGGGNIGSGGGGVEINGSIISKDEAMVVWSLPIKMNYDNRSRERTLNKTPLIDLQLPRSPVMLRSTWLDRGFGYAGASSESNEGNEEQVSNLE
ncbi:MAG: hypothetical protein JNM04_03665 [Chthonomonas sp.]|nr:hypothetical protein [Chthonomonas sp.]